MTLDLYTLHSTPEPGEFIIQKFDTDYHCESVYALSSLTCMCPQGHKPKCRHRTMLPMFLAHGHIGDGWFLEWNTRMWRRPINDVAIEPESPKPTFRMVHDGSNLLADETVMGTSVGKEGVSGISPFEPGATTEPAPAAPSVAPPPSPPEGPQPSLSAEAAPASPVVAGVIVKRRKIP